MVKQSFLFGDSHSVITSSTVPQSPLSKRQLALAYHQVCEAVAAKILQFLPINGKANPVDILSKHCSHVQAYPLLKPLLFWRGETAGITKQPKGSSTITTEVKG